MGNCLLLWKGEEGFFKVVIPRRPTTPQWMAPHPETVGQHSGNWLKILVGVDGLLNIFKEDMKLEVGLGMLVWTWEELTGTDGCIRSKYITYIP